jgi:hypothetical protein
MTLYILGYQYDWTNRKYPDLDTNTTTDDSCTNDIDLHRGSSRNQSNFPESLSSYIAHIMNVCDIHNSSIICEAAIVNYYEVRSTHNYCYSIYDVKY